MEVSYCAFVTGSRLSGLPDVSVVDRNGCQAPASIHQGKPDHVPALARPVGKVRTAREEVEPNEASGSMTETRPIYLP